MPIAVRASLTREPPGSRPHGRGTHDPKIQGHIERSIVLRESQLVREMPICRVSTLI